MVKERWSANHGLHFFALVSADAPGAAVESVPVSGQYGVGLVTSWAIPEPSVLPVSGASWSGISV